jgi:hypothetical protein
LTHRGEQVFDRPRAGEVPASRRKGVDQLGTIRILDSSGDTELAWDLADHETVRAAEEVFERLLVTERKIPFARRAGAPADSAVQIREFDPVAEEILFVRPITGG